MMRHSRAFALFLALSFALSGEGFRLRRVGEHDVAADSHPDIEEPSREQEDTDISLVEEEEARQEEPYEKDAQEDGEEVEEGGSAERDVRESLFIDEDIKDEEDSIDNEEEEAEEPSLMQADENEEQHDDGQVDGEEMEGMDEQGDKGVIDEEKEDTVDEQDDEDTFREDDAQVEGMEPEEQDIEVVGARVPRQNSITVHCYSGAYGCDFLDDWIHKYKKVVEPKLKYRTVRYNPRKKFNAWLKTNSKSYGKQAAKHKKCTQRGWCQAFVVFNGKYISNKYTKGDVENIRPALLKKVEVWGFKGMGLSKAIKEVKEAKSRKEFQTDKIKAFESKSAFRVWLKANGKRWGKVAAKQTTSPFVVVNGKFIGGYKKLEDLLDEFYREH